MDTRRKAMMRSAGDKEQSEETKTNDDEILQTPSKPIEEYERVFAQNTEFFSTYCPDMIEEAILDFLRKQQIEPMEVHA